MEKTTLEKQGRIFIPKRLRHRLGLRTGQELMLQVTKEGILLKPSLSVEEFSIGVKGCIKDGKNGFSCSQEDLEIKRLITHDQAFQNINSITVFDPIDI